MRKYRIIAVLLLIFLAVGISIFVYSRFHPIINIKTEIINITEKNRSKLDIENTQKHNYKTLNFTLNIKYSKQIDDIKIDIPYSFRELLGEDIYWKGSGYQFKDPVKHAIEYKEEIIINYLKVENKDIKDLLSKGTINVIWKIDGKEKSKTFNIGETITFANG